MKRLWTIIGVRHVPASFRWYQTLLGLAETAPAHDDFGQIVDTDGTVLLCLHQWGAHEHPSLMSPDKASPGNGLLLFFRVDDYDMALMRTRALVLCVRDLRRPAGIALDGENLGLRSSHRHRNSAMLVRSPSEGGAGGPRSC